MTSSLQTCSHPKIYLFWLRSTSHLPLSLNIIREVSSYLDDFPMLIDVLFDRVVVYQPIARRWETLFSLQGYVEVTYMTAIVPITRRQVITCGGLSFVGKVQTASASAFLLSESAVVSLEKMKYCRYAHGAVYREDRRSVYVFGGAEGSHARLRTAERFALEEKTWVSLPSMKTPRMNFSPCAFHEVIYLCGGMCPVIELFNLANQTYTQLPHHLPEEINAKWKHAACVNNGKLVIFSLKHIWKCDLQRNSQPETVTRAEASDVRSRCPPAVYCGVLLILVGNGCEALCINSGAVNFRRGSNPPKLS